MGWNLRGEESRIISEINITPLTDVMLVLLVIFMVTTPLLMIDSFKVKLPAASTATPEKSRGLTISVSEDGRVSLNGRPVALDALEAAVRDEIAKSVDKTVLVRADGSARHRVVVEVLDSARRAGAERLSIAAEREKAGGTEAR